MPSLQKLKVAPTLVSTEYDGKAQTVMKATFEEIAEEKAKK